MKKSLMIPALVFLLSQLVFAQNPQWVDLTPTISDSYVRSIAIDSSRSVVWLGMWRSGIWKFDGSSWTHYDTTISPLFSYPILSIAISDDNILYASTSSIFMHNTWFIKFDGENWEFYNPSNSNILPGPYFSISPGNDYVLIGSVNGASVLDLKTNTFTNYTTTNSGLPWHSVQAVNTEGHVKWMGTQSRGLARFDDTTWTIYNSTNSGLITNNILKIQITPDGLKWIVCREGGINRFNSETNQWDAYFLGVGVYRAGAVDYTTGNMACEISPPSGLLFYRASDSTYLLFNYTNSPIGKGDAINSLEFDRYGNLWIGGLRSFIYNENGVVGIDKNSTIITEIPQDFKLYQNFPNPFNPSTRIKYEVTKRSSITLRVYNINGKLVKILDSGYKPIGEYEINFDGNGLPSGVYFYKLEAGSFIETKRMLLLK